jgi:heptosyltransferase-2
MIGDVLTSSLLFEMLREHYPVAQLDYLVNANTLPVIENNPFFDNVCVFTPEIEASKSELNAFRKKIKSEGYDVVIDVYSKLGSAILTKFSGAKKRIGYQKWYTKHKYTQTFVPKTISNLDEGLAIENRVLLLEPLVGEGLNIPKPKIYLRPEEIEKAEEQLIQHGIDLNKSLFMIGILGSDTAKTYPLPYMANLLDYIVSETRSQLIFNYIPNQQSDADALYTLCSEKTREHIFKDVYGSNIRQFLALTAHCKALIGNEGGAVNMAKALNIPTFSIFAPWIMKEAWNSYEATGKNASVHLKDFYPELYKKHPKKYKKQAETLYRQFAPDYIIPEIKDFLSNL